MDQEKSHGVGNSSSFIPGILTAIVLGWDPSKLAMITNYHQIESLFPRTGVVSEVYDGDTFKLVNGTEVRLVGINAPNRGEEKYEESKQYWNTVIDGKRVYLEYDRYQDEKYGRVLSWV